MALEFNSGVVECQDRDGLILYCSLQVLPEALNRLAQYLQEGRMQMASRTYTAIIEDKVANAALQAIAGPQKAFRLSTLPGCPYGKIMAINDSKSVQVLF